MVDIIVNSENHETLETAVIEAGLTEYLSGDGPFTVFAPTDEAFEALPEGLLTDLLADPTGQLADILKHHVASGNVLSTDLNDGMMITTLADTELTVTFTDNGVMIDNAMVTTANLTADNGVVHVINAVLVPENVSIDDNYLDNDIRLFTYDVYGRLVKNDIKNKIIIDMYRSGKTVKKIMIK